MRDATESGRDTKRHHDGLPINSPMSHANASTGTPHLDPVEVPEGFLTQEPESAPLSPTSTLLNTGSAPFPAHYERGDVLIKDFAMERTE